MKHSGRFRFLPVAAALLLPLLLAALSACGRTEIPVRPEEKRVPVLLADAEGLTPVGSSSLLVPRGSSVEFSYRLEDGYTVDGYVGGYASGSSVVAADNIRYPTTVIVRTRPLRDCGITVLTAGENGCGTASADRAQCREGDPLLLTAVPTDDFRFAGFSENAPLSEGGALISTEAECTYIPSDTVTVYANFERAYAEVSLADTPGLIKKTSDTLRAEVGTRPFFMIDVAEGYVLDRIGPGLTYEAPFLFVNKVSVPTEYYVTTLPLTEYIIQINNNVTAGGKVTVEPDRKSGWDGETVRFTAECADSYVFNGYTEGASLESGGKLLSESTEMTLTLDRHLFLVANFELKTYRVTLKEVPGLTVTSAKELTVPAGGTAEFTFTVDDSYALDSAGAAALSGGKIVLANVFADTEIVPETHELSARHFTFRSANELWGDVTADKPEGFYRNNTEITLTAKPGLGAFDGFYIGTKKVSSEEKYTFRITGDTEVTARFREPPDPALTVAVPKDKWVVLYHPNGGKIVGTADKKSPAGYYYTEFANTYYHCPNALPSMNQFEREGYVLLGYNTEWDGSGTYYGPGWNIVIPERGAITLYCVWARETPASDFRYSVSAGIKTVQYSKKETYTGKYVTITSYLGDADTVVIPEKIDGFPVTDISASCFVSEAKLETLVLSRYMSVLNVGTMNSCGKFRSLYMFDSVQTMPNNWYLNCPEFSSLHLLAARNPTYSTTRNGTYAIKFEWLMTAPGQKIVLVSGSNTAYGVDSPLLEQKLADAGFKYSVVNYGQNASSAAAFYIEVCSHFLNPGDILVAEPEFSNKYQFGYNEVNSTLMQIFEGAYDAFSYVDIRHYVKTFSVIAAFNKTCSTRSALTYEKYTTDTVNRWGDYSLTKKGATSSWKTTLDGYDANGGVGSLSFTSGTNILKANTAYSENGRTLHYITEINRVYDMVTAAGAKMLFSGCTIVKTKLTAASQIYDGADQKAFMAAVDQYLHATRISHSGDFVFGREYSYNSDWHVNTEGQIKRTGILAEDLIKYLKK